MDKMVDSKLIWSQFSAIYGNTLHLTELSSVLEGDQGNMYVSDNV